MRKFIKGTFELRHVADLDAFEKNHHAAIEELIEWADDRRIALRFGMSDDGAYLCEYKVVGNTVSYCKGMVAELKQRLKAEFFRCKSLIQLYGNIMF